MQQKRNWIQMLVYMSEKLVGLLRLCCMLIASVFLSALALQVLMRYVFTRPIYGLDEWVICMMIWFSSIGSAVVFWEEGHARIEYFLKFFPKPYRLFWNVVEYVSVLVCGVVFIIGARLLFAMQVRTAVLGGIPFSRAYYYALPVGVFGGLLIALCVVRFLEFLFDRQSFEKIERGGTDT